MPFVKFEHNSYGPMMTTAEYWIQYSIFDATDERGDVFPVSKDDCHDPKCVES